MQTLTQLNRNTTADEVFHHLHDRIVSLKLVPGTRISEVEIAREFDISRQPVREAFIRLANLNLLLILPQKFTVVRGFSSEKIKRSRFIRMATECEILRRACRLATTEQFEILEQDLEDQQNSAKKMDSKTVSHPRLRFSQSPVRCRRLFLHVQHHIGKQGHG